MFDIVDWAQALTLELGLPGVFLVSVISTGSLFFFPIADIFYIPWSVEAGIGPAYVGVVWGIGAALGELVAYALGRLSNNLISLRKRMVRTRRGIPSHTLYFTVGRAIKRHTEPEDWTSRYGFWAIPIFAFTPLPMDLLGLALGYLRYNVWKFSAGVLAGKLPRSLLMAYGLSFFRIPLWLIILAVAASGAVAVIARRIRV